MKKVLGIGNALVDVMTILDNDSIIEELAFPRGSMTLVDNETSRKIKDKTKDLEISLASGGSAANTIHALALMGVESAFIGAVGKDETGDFFENDMKSAGANTSLLRKNIDTGTAVAMISPDSERTFATHLGAAIELNEKNLERDLFKGYDYLYLEGYLITNLALVKKACSIARGNNMKIAIDLASFNVVEEFLDDFKFIVREYIDIIFANEEEARAFTGLEPDMALSYLADLCEIAVVKIGSEGSIIKRGDEIIKVEALKVSSRDTTGAGDLYASGFLYGMSRGDSLAKCGSYGTILAGNIIEVIGAKMDKEKWDSVREMIYKVSKSG